MVMNGIFIAIGAFFGAISRFSLSQLIKRIYPVKFPAATFFINLSGSFLLGLLFGLGAGSSWRLLLGTGFMGAFTTFSTFKLENIQLHAEKQWRILIPYLALSYVIGIAMAFLGIMLGDFLA
ncbi:putative fluoride ion transporter CrcB 2 [Weizmannia acidilactici]|uniref:Fluoride-specific ion channel FluC n=1 Tax=Weizmannia acidilactici TaxID=2607726 RepID=A0A5J4J2A3_9BACI|nr:fluoride efflux transporter CrcB [Weizmannia acidilactici]GER66278.1 putative fluoride ion transporter CrcB 2 [Weizmannia acidilactici]GER69086.1 putative fluoride ion transporter CrcB 2 [Weizmannia acidilactici]GER72217.1 putative fluoride ion transporter CrcB 2 [Weizmannia acidilactici]